MGDGALLALANDQAVLALFGAGGMIAGADSVCQATFGQWWYSHDPEHLARVTPRARVGAGVDWLCATVRALPEDESAATVRRLEAFVAAYRAVTALDELAGPEAFATAVAFNPELADLMPRPGMRDVLGREVGSNLAAAELTELRVAVARRVATLGIEDQARLVRDLWIESVAE